MSERHSDHSHSTTAKRRRSEETPLPTLYDTFNGEVSSVQPYGIFVKIPGSSRQGLVHKSQISKARVDDPSEMFTKGERVYCKVISIDKENDREKIALSMKTVNQTSGQDLDPNNIELSQDEKKRKQGGFRHERKKIELEAVLDTTCRKCGGKGHLAQDCFKTEGDKTYDLIPDMDDYMKTLSQERREEPTHKHKKKKKEKKQRKEKKEKKKKKHKRRHSSSSDTETDSDSSPRKHKKKKHHRRSYSSSDG